MREFLFKTLWLLILLYFSPKIYASPLIISNNETTYHFVENIELFKTTDQSLSIQNIQNQTFIPYENWKDQLEPNLIYWGKFQLQNEQTSTIINKSWVMTFPVILTEVDLYVITPDGKMVTRKTGSFVPFSKRHFEPIVKGNFLNFDIKNNETVTIYFKAKCERKNALPKFDLQLSSTHHFFYILNEQKQNRGLFIGFVLMMLVYNLFLFFFNAKDKAYIFYSFYLLGIVVFSTYNTGDLADKIKFWFFPEHPEYNHYLKTTVYFTMICYLIFLRSFLDLSNLLPRWDTIFKYLSWLMFAMIFVDIYLLYISNFNPNVADFATVGTALIFILSTFSFCWFLYPTKDKKGYFIVLGTLLMGVGVLLTLWGRLDGIDFSTFYFRVGTILEIIVFSLGLAYRRNEIENEKQNAFFELERSNILQDQKRKEAERLKELDQFKTQLYTNITHEFRTPLTVIMGLTDSIEDHENEKKIITRNSNQLLRLINQVLDLSKIETNLMKVNLVQSNIVIFLQYLTESFHSMARSKNINLTFYSEEDHIQMDFDEVKIEHLTYNLISNAIKFTPSAGKIIFHIKETEIDKTKHLQIKIKDTGKGISEENLPFIFDRFYQSKDTDSVTGTGIGLALVKEIVELLHGTITVNSKLGAGSEFIVNLPITQQAEEVIPSILTKVPVPQNEIIELNPAAEENFDPDLPILLLIEDNRDVSNYIQNFLSKDYNIQFAFDGKKGIEEALRLIPDIIISDVMMPYKNGFEVTQILKNDERTSHIPIILLTAKASQEDRIDGLKSGADAFLLKPFNKKELLVRLENLHHQRQLIIKKFNTNLEESIEESQPEPLSMDEIFLQKISQFIEENITDSNLGIDDICKISDLSKNQMYRKIKALTNLPPTLFIRTIRLNKAKYFLKSNNSNISEVAYMVGFKDPNYFSRVFHQEFGITPRDFVNN